MIHRPITTTELIQLNKFFSAGRGYKDLKRDIEKEFHIKMTTQEAKQFMKNRSWSELLKWLTGDDIDTGDLDHIPAIEYKHFELLEQMIKFNKVDEAERVQELEEFMKGNYYIPDNVNFFNIPLYGEIITYKFKEPFLKCFLLNDKRKIDKIEDVPISEELPHFLLSIIRKINSSTIEFKGNQKDLFKIENLKQPITYYSTTEDIEREQLKNIFETPLFKKYNIVYK